MYTCVSSLGDIHCGCMVSYSLFSKSVFPGGAQEGRGEMITPKPFLFFRFFTGPLQEAVSKGWGTLSIELRIFRLFWCTRVRHALERGSFRLSHHKDCEPGHREARQPHITDKEQNTAICLYVSSSLR